MSRWYAGKRRTEKGIKAHRVGRSKRHQKNPIDRIKSDLASSHCKREKRINATRA